jgi:hypothetical protein
MHTRTTLVNYCKDGIITNVFGYISNARYEGALKESGEPEAM